MAVAAGTLAALVFLALVVVAAPRYGALDNALWRWAYGRYLDSQVWRSTKIGVLARDGYTCQHCQHIIQEWADAQPHHKPGTYRRWTFYALAPVLGLREDPTDLVTLCRECHAAVHGKEL